MLYDRADLRVDPLMSASCKALNRGGREVCSVAQTNWKRWTVNLLETRLENVHKRYFEPSTGFLVGWHMPRARTPWECLLVETNIEGL